MSLISSCLPEDTAKKRYSEEQIVQILWEAQTAPTKVEEGHNLVPTHACRCEDSRCSAYLSGLAGRCG